MFVYFISFFIGFHVIIGVTTSYLGVKKGFQFSLFGLIMTLLVIIGIFPNIVLGIFLIPLIIAAYITALPLGLSLGKDYYLKKSYNKRNHTE